MPSTRPRTLWLGLLLGCVALAGLFREVNNQRHAHAADGDPDAGWFVADPDSLYHVRRLSRFLEDGAVAERDPYLNWRGSERTEEGARIPWPPYYTHTLGVLLGALAPGADDASGAARGEFLERGVALLPFLFALLTTALVAWAGLRLGGPVAAAFAGGTHALLGASLVYSAPGIGDHHAWASLLGASQLAIASVAAARDGRRPVALGVLGGLLAGLLVGSWVGGLVHVLVVQLTLGWMLLFRVPGRDASLARFGLAYHLALAAAIAPAVLSSPWKADFPWMVVNLSWFHLAHPLAGALVFVPLLVLPETSRVRARLGLVVLGVLVAAGLAAATLDLPLARGVREGFAWAGRANTFMAYIDESQPLIGGRGGVGDLFLLLGAGALVAPLAVGWAAWRAWKHGDLALLPWVIGALAFGAQAWSQKRFAESFGVPMAVIVGWAAARASERWNASGKRTAAFSGLALVLAIALQATPVRLTVLRLTMGTRTITGLPGRTQRGLRELYGWLRARRAAGEPTACVLASWDQGHALEQVADWPTVATNFGSYLGEDSYLDPWRFFLEESEANAEALLERRGARYVLVPGNFNKDLEVMLRLLRPSARSEYVARQGDVIRAGPRWYRTMVGRLMLDGRVADPVRGQLVGSTLPFLRLVHVSPTELGGPPPIPHAAGPWPAGWIWERVAGARVTARGAAGEELKVELEVVHPNGARVPFLSSAVADDAGVARVRVPYATDAPNGDGRAAGPARWSFGGARGTVAIPERAVLEGGEVLLR